VTAEEVAKAVPVKVGRVKEAAVVVATIGAVGVAPAATRGVAGVVPAATRGVAGVVPAATRGVVGTAPEPGFRDRNRFSPTRSWPVSVSLAYISSTTP
jgi:hypothetical protein